MSVPFFGDYDTTETVDIPVNTFSSDDPSASVTITDLVAGDVEIHKDGGTTQRASDNGVTVSIDFDGVTGNHMVHVDLSDNSDAGYYSDGSRCAVRIEGVTVDGATLNVWIGAFSIGCTLRPTTAGRTLDIQSTGEVDANLTMMGGATQSATDLKDFADDGYDPSTHVAQADMTYIHGTGLTETAGQLANRFSDYFNQAAADISVAVGMRGTDSAALASVCTETRLAELDAANLPTDIAAIPTTAMRGTDSAALASVCTETRLAELDAANLPADVAAIPTTAMRGTDNAALASVCTETRLAELDAANIPTDTARLTAARAAVLTDLIDGGRLDLLIDAIKVVTDAITAAAAAKLALSAGTIVSGAAAAGTLSTTQMTTNLTEATDDHYNGRLLTWTSGVLTDQQTDITDYDGATKKLTYTAVTEAPSADDTFVIQ